MLEYYRKLNFHFLKVSHILDNLIIFCEKMWDGGGSDYLLNVCQFERVKEIMDWINTLEEWTWLWLLHV